MKYKNILNYFKKQSDNDVFKNMGILAIGVGGAQVISFALTPILTRIYTPEDFGILAIFMATAGVIGPFATLRYSVPLPLLKKDGIALNLFMLAVIILLVVTSLVVSILNLYAEVIFDLFSISSLIPYWWFIPIIVFGSGAYEILNGWSIRQKNFKAISKTNVFKTLSGSLMKIVFGLAGIKPMGLLIGTIFANIFGAIFLAVSNYKNIIKNIKHVNKYRVKFLLKRYSEYPKYRLPSQFILVLSQQAPLFFLATFYGADVVGFFGLTLMVLSVPIALFGSTTGQAYYAEVAKIGRKNPEKIYYLTKDVVKKLFLFSLIPFLILLIGSPWLFGIIFGENWYKAGEYASVMSFYMLTAFVSAPVINALSVFENQLMFLKLNIIRLMLLIILFFISWLMHLNASETIFFYSIGMSGYFIYINYVIFKTIKNEIRIRNKR